MRLHDLKGIAVFVCLTLALALGSPAAVWAASEGGHESGGLISLDKSLIVQAINFLILLFILQRLLYKPFLAKMGERTAARRPRRGGGHSRPGDEGSLRGAEASGRGGARRIAAARREREGADGRGRAPGPRGAA